MRKLLITILSLWTALIAYFLFKSNFKKKKQRTISEYKLIVNGMRVIENPFIETDNKREIKPVADVVVVNNDYDWWKVYKNDILYLIGIFTVCVLVIFASFFANKTRVASEEKEQYEKEQLESSVVHSLDSIAKATINLTEMVDSMNAYIKEKPQNVQEGQNSQPKTQRGERKKK